MAKNISKQATGVEARDAQDAQHETRWFFQPGHYAKQRAEFAADESGAVKAAIDADALETPRKG